MKVARIVKPNGLFGKKRGFRIIEILLAVHGGSHYDTITTIDKNVGKKKKKKH